MASEFGITGRDRSRRMTYTLSAKFTRTTQYAEQVLKGKKRMKIRLIRDFSSLASACEEAMRTPGREAHPSEVHKLQRFCDRVHELGTKRASRIEYQQPRFNPSDGFVALENRWKSHADSCDALTHRLRPFAHNDLPFDELCNKVLGLRSKETRAKAKQELMDCWELRKTSEIVNYAFVRSGNFKAFAMLVSGEIGDSRGDFQVIYPCFLKNEPEPAQPEGVSDLLTRLFDGDEAFIQGEINACRIIDEEFFMKWMKKYEWHAGVDSDFFEPYMDTRNMRTLVRTMLFPALIDKVTAALWLRDILVSD